MGQRLGIASALLGDPSTVILDEPVNGLDPEGIRWVRDLLRGLAAEGRTVFLSSHMMSEMQLAADHVIVVGKGRLITDMSMEELTRSANTTRVFVRTPQVDQLRAAVAGPNIVTTSEQRDSVEVTGLTSEQIGTAAAEAGIVLYELTPQQASLEDTFMALTADAVEFHAHDTNRSVA
jgi:ABC-2 type transport system ATP-binding protein